jgi:hypothetical protein
VAAASIVHPARSARSTRPAPRFWPTTAAAAAPKPTPIMYSQLSMRNPTPSAASAGVPSADAVRPMITYTRLKNTPVAAVGSPTRAMVPSTRASAGRTGGARAGAAARSRPRTRARA